MPRLSDIEINFSRTSGKKRERVLIKLKRRSGGSHLVKLTRGDNQWYINLYNIGKDYGLDVDVLDAIFKLEGVYAQLEISNIWSKVK